jgi:very-short-patch-repair endonuclease
LRIYCHCLEADEVVTMDGIPVTTVARTLLDLAVVLPPEQLERAVNEAEVQRLLRPLQLQRMLGRYPRRHGTPALSAILDARDGITRSELEAKFSRLIRSANLPRPELNRLVTAGAQPFECDCVWRPQRLIVELDGRAFHVTAAAFERDRARDRRLQAAGWTVVRVTWRQLREEPETVVADLRTLLRRDSASRAVL